MRRRSFREKNKCSEIRVIHRFLSFVRLFFRSSSRERKKHEGQEHGVMNLFVKEACCVKSARGLATISF